MTISKRLKLSYIALVIIPFLTFYMASNIYEDKYIEMLGNLKLSIQTNSFNKELYNILGTSPDKLLDNKTMEHLISLTRKPNAIIGFVDIEGIPYNTSDNFTNKNIKSYNSQKYINYWLFNLSDGRIAEIYFINTAFTAKHRIIAFLIPLIFYMLFITLLSYIISRSITRPLFKLRDAANCIKNEEFDIVLNYNSRDEIKEVFTAFDDMRIKLKHIVEKQLLYEESRKELITNISHDLRTPITAIKGYIEGLVDGVANTPEKINRYHETIYKKINLLNAMIENLFLSSKLDLEEQRFNFQKINLNLFIFDILEEFRFDNPNTILNYQQLTKKIDIIGDPIELQRVINNILENSIKYCDKRNCIINITLSKHDKNAKINFKDNGPGIKQDEGEDIFKRFYRSDPARSSSTEGSGLGLAIAKKIIEGHNGEIFTTKKLIPGLEITIILPLIKEQEK